MSSETSFPLRAACVDTGSNAIRFVIAEFTAQDTYSVLVSQRVPVRLGHQVFLTGRLHPATMDAAVEAFVSFHKQMDDYDVVRYRAVATSAVREAKNGQKLVDRVRKKAGIELEMISGSEEARLVHLSVASRVNLTGGQWILVDLGGGSVEVSLVDDMGMLWTESHTMGSVRLLEELAAAGQEPGGYRRLLSEYISVLRIPSPVQYWEPSGFVATGGNIESLADLASAQPGADGVAMMSVADLESAIELLARLSYHERVETLGLREDRADVILPAAMVYHHLARLSGVRDIHVPKVGLKEGILLDLVDALTAHSNHEVRQEELLLKAAISLGRRFMFDEAHGMHVAVLARTIFDGLMDVHGMETADRRLLTAAAVLHDIGQFVSHKGHHKHSLYVLSRSELPGLSPREMLMVANVARYHRKNAPRDGHGDFRRLTEEERDRVTKLAALLRVADALDRTHIQDVEGVEVSVKKKRVDLKLVGSGDFLLERWTLTRKGGLFEKLFGMEVTASS